MERDTLGEAATSGVSVEEGEGDEAETEGVEMQRLGGCVGLKLRLCEFRNRRGNGGGLSEKCL